jgi:hypothetical protein
MLDWSARQVLVWVVILGTASCGSRALPGDQGAQGDGPPQGSDAGVVDGPPSRLDAYRHDAGRPLEQQVVEACAFAAACSGWHMQPPVTPSQCVEWFAYRDWPRGGLAGIGPSMLWRLIACAPAGDCKAFQACYGGSWFGPTSCREGGQCSEEMLYTQANNALMLHCDELGGTCMDLPTGAIRACCVLETCAGTSETTCHPSPGGSSKKGTHCMLGIAWDFDCEPVGQSCSTVPGQLCVGPGAFCDPKTTKVTCTGSVAKYCVGKTDGTGNIATTDCAETVFHSGCNAGTSYDPCKPAGSECTASYSGECQGSRLLVCVDGHKVAVDCEAIGFDLCGTPPPDKTPRCMYAR